MAVYTPPNYILIESKDNENIVINVDQIVYIIDDGAERHIHTNAQRRSVIETPLPLYTLYSMIDQSRISKPKPY